MKLSIVLSTQPATFSALPYQGRLAESIRKIRNLGYEGVELAIRNPSLLDVPTLKSLLAAEPLTVPAIGTGQAFGEDGLSFTHPEPGIRRKAIDRVKSHIHLAAAVGAVVIIGLVRGKRGTGVTADQAAGWLTEALRECAVEDRSVRLAIEPINRYETDLLNTAGATLEFVEKLGLENVGLLLDTFHMNIEESSLAASVEAARNRLFHVHIADSNRRYPGAGHIDFRSMIDTLHRIGYGGFLSAEILPLPDPDSAASNTIVYMRKLSPEEPATNQNLRQSRRLGVVSPSKGPDPYAL